MRKTTQLSIQYQKEVVWSVILLFQEIGCANKPIGSERNDGLILPIMNSKSIMEQKEKSEIDKFEYLS